LGWALAGTLALVAPFLPFAVYPRWRGGSGTAVITLKAVSLNGWTTQGEEPRVGIVLAVCAALFAATAILPLLRPTWRWIGAVAALSVMVGVVSTMVLYLVTGTTRTAQISAGHQTVRVVRSAALVRSGCLWLALAAIVVALGALAIQLNTAREG
jgi:hypothetical protein